LKGDVERSGPISDIIDASGVGEVPFRRDKGTFQESDQPGSLTVKPFAAKH